MKIFHVLTRLNLGGAALYNLLIASRLQDKGHEVWVISGAAGKHEAEMLDYFQQNEVNFRLVRIPELQRELHPWRDIVAFVKLARLFHREKPDVVHTHMSKAGAIARPAAALAGVPVRVHSFHGTVFSNYFDERTTTMVARVERLLARWSDRLFTDTSLVREQAIEHRVAAAEKIHVLTLGLELDQYADLTPFRGRLRKKLGIPCETKVVGAVARLVPIKDVGCLLDAAHKVLAVQPGVHFVIAGDGESRHELEQRAEALGIAPSVTFLGFWPDLRDVYADSDLLALTSLSEGCPVAILEAMAAGLPVVASAVGGVPDVVIPGVNGLIFPPADPARCGEAILSLLSSPEAMRAFGTNGKTLAFEKYTIDRSADETERHYLSLLSQRGGDRDRAG